jgi:hypothetical protein
MGRARRRLRRHESLRVTMVAWPAGNCRMEAIAVERGDSDD